MPRSTYSHCCPGRGVWTDTQSENITFPYSSDAGGNKVIDKINLCSYELDAFVEEGSYWSPNGFVMYTSSESKWYVFCTVDYIESEFKLQDGIKMCDSCYQTRGSYT